MIYLLIEFLDELVGGVSETAWPLIRDDLDLTYTQIGLLLSLPGLLAALIEPFLGILGDLWKRRVLIIGGGVLFALSLVLTATSYSFLLLLISFIIINPSSGAFVGLSQASWMDSDAARHEQNMARWTFAGSAGVLAGPLLLGIFVYLGFGWRGAYAFLASFAVLCLMAAFKFIPHDKKSTAHLPTLYIVREGFRAAFSALKRKEIWRWLLLLDFADLVMDVLLSYLALYLVDVVLVTEGQAGIGVTLWLALGLATDFIFIAVADRQTNSMKFLRFTALLEVLALSMFLLVAGFIPKLIAIVFVNIFNTGWYPILKGRLYSALPGQSASLLAIQAVTTPLARFFPFLLGLLADRIGLGTAMWILLLGPIALIIGLPRRAARLAT